MRQNHQPPKNKWTKKDIQIRVTRERCFDFFLITEKFGENISCYLSQKFDHNIVFLEKANFFAEKWQKSPKIVIITSTPDWANVNFG
jgi:hypothetical protein